MSKLVPAVYFSPGETLSYKSHILSINNGFDCPTELERLLIWCERKIEYAENMPDGLKKKKNQTLGKCF